MQSKEIVLNIEALEFEGKGVAHFEGKVYFVAGGVPGDVVKCKIKKSRKSYAEAEIIEILRPSGKRIVPLCKHFGVCGGCRLQHIGYEDQLQYKQKAVEDALRHIGGLSEAKVLPIIGADNIFHYRNKMEFTFSDKKWLLEEDKLSETIFKDSFGLGLHIPNRYDKVLDIEKCWLQNEVFNRILNLTRDFVKEQKLSVYSNKTHEGYLRHLMIRTSAYSGEIMINLVTSTHNLEVMDRYTEHIIKNVPEVTTVVNNVTTRMSKVAIGEEEKVYYGNGYILEKLGKCLFKISANSFFQTNTEQAAKLYDLVKDYSNFKNTDVVYDLYCGTGSIAIYISDYVKEVIGIELVESAVNDARKNVELNNIKNCIFIQGDLKEILTSKDFKKSGIKPDIVILDPPRSGVHPTVLKVVSDVRPRIITYVSCNPTTLSRDLKILSQSEYQVLFIQPVDMFPQTYHIESIAVLESLK
ncbi:MAG: RNA methyltransferase, TrmA family [Ignavibacteriae bacterium]|nr:MAG: RNA methyltransferase, TrmA family [Ignavibacteriota bacterium]